MNKIEELFCDIGLNIKVFVCGWIATMIGAVLGILAVHIIK
jgi:hypothetical protein